MGCCLLTTLLPDHWKFRNRFSISKNVDPILTEKEQKKKETILRTQTVEVESQKSKLLRSSPLFYAPHSLLSFFFLSSFLSFFLSSFCLNFSFSVWLLEPGQSNRCGTLGIVDITISASRSSRPSDFSSAIRIEIRSSKSVERVPRFAVSLFRKARRGRASKVSNDRLIPALVMFVTRYMIHIYISIYTHCVFCRVLLLHRPLGSDIDVSFLPKTGKWNRDKERFSRIFVSSPFSFLSFRFVPPSR